MPKSTYFRTLCALLPTFGLGVTPLLVACGSSPPAEQGQSSLINKTFVGETRCSAKSHDRPFIIEWDATDMSSFEAKAASDVVFVKYTGCELQVLDGCSNDSVKGALGAYGTPEWTSGALEKIDIANENELYAKLPLGVSTLGGRVQNGEQFHMEYFVSGTRKATRDEVYRTDLASIPRCKGATHFVYAYNLGAFALGSAKQLNVEAGATVWGFGAGGNKKSTSNAEKKGGVLTSCSGETAKETSTCKVPIRLTLREISENENPDAVAAIAPETPAAVNLAGKVDTKLKMGEEARARYQAAVERMNARDGKACIRELNAYDKLDPKNASNSPRSPLATTRATCVMLSGMCDAGKQQFKKAWEAQTQLTPEQLDAAVEGQAANYCQGASMSARDQLLKAHHELQQGSATKKDVTFCKTNFDTVNRLAKTVKPKDDEDFAVKNASGGSSLYFAASGCFARAGDCAAAFRIWQDGQREGGRTLTASEMDQRKSFSAASPVCKTWATSQALSPRDQVVHALRELQQGAVEKSDSATCKKNHENVTRLAAALPADPTDSDVTQAKNQVIVSSTAMACFAKAGDCDGAFKMAKLIYPTLPEASQRASVAAQAPACKK